MSETHEREKMLEENPDLLKKVEQVKVPTDADVPLANILDKIAEYNRTFVALSDDQLTIIPLWVIHTYTIRAADCTPYLSITSAEKQSGKTRQLEVLEKLVANPWFTSRVTAAVLVRKIEADKPTLLLDESDAAFQGDKEYSEALRGILNAGHRRRSAKVSLCVGQGKNIDFRDFAVFCPKAIAGIGRLPDTVADRSIPIRLQRQKRDERVAKFRDRMAEQMAAPIRSLLKSWAASSLKSLKGATPQLPDELSDRQQDVAEPLLAIADAAGPVWATRARAALLRIFAGNSAADQSHGVQLLADIRQAFTEADADRLRSEDLVQALTAMEGHPWAEINHGKAITKNGLARLLRKYEISPRTVRFFDSGKPTDKGYQREWFEDVWSRYLNPDSEPSQPSQSSIHAGETAFLKASQDSSVTDSKSEKSPINMRAVTDVTVQTPEIDDGGAEGLLQ